MSEHANPDYRLRRILIVGGGSAGWMTAAALSKILKNNYAEITLIESDLIGTVGVGEATIPQIGTFNRTLGIDENEFVRRTKGTFKLGIEFVDWGADGERYIHPFGPYGLDMDGVSFHAFFVKQHKDQSSEALAQYSLQAQAAAQNRFMRPINAGNSPLSKIAYAFHFDAGLYAQFLRREAELRGVRRVEGTIKAVEKRAEDDNIDHVVLDDGRRFEADLFVDCSGFRGLLIEQALGAGYVDWSHYLPTNSAVAVPSSRTEPLLPYTRSTAREAGWQWRIPLQHRTGNGYVYSTAFTDDDRAANILLSSLDGKALADPRVIRFTAGHRKRFWIGNCVSIGLSAGFLEPLESTSLHLIQSGIARMLQMLPDRRFSPVDIARYNRVCTFEYERIRDFIVLHYHATRRSGSAFWDYVRTMPIPDYLADKIALFESHGRIFRENEELFNDTSWFAVMNGQGLRARDYDPVADVQDAEETRRRLAHIRETIATCADRMPAHAEFIDNHCAAAREP